MPNSTLNAGQGCPQWAWGGGVHAAFKWGSFIGVNTYEVTALGGRAGGERTKEGGLQQPYKAAQRDEVLHHWGSGGDCPIGQCTGRGSCAKEVLEGAPAP